MPWSCGSLTFRARSNPAAIQWRPDGSHSSHSSHNSHNSQTGVNRPDRQTADAIKQYSRPRHAPAVLPLKHQYRCQTSLTGLLLPLPLHFALSTAALTRMPGISRRAPPCESRPVQYFCNQNHQLSWWYALCLKGINTGSPTRALNKIYISIKFTGYC